MNYCRTISALLSANVVIALAMTICLFSVSKQTFAQSDLGTESLFWKSIDLNVKLNKKVSVKQSFQLRSRVDIPQLRSVFSETGISYDFADNWRISGLYRFTRQANTHKQRWFSDLEYGLPVKIFKIKNEFRLRYQWERTASDFQSQHLRFAYKLIYRIKKTDYRIIGMTESFFHLLRGRTYWSRYRFRIGASKKINKKHKLYIGYTYQNDINTTSPQISHIAHLKYNYYLKLKKKKGGE